jgi:nickel superoxide dismutase
MQEKYQSNEDPVYRTRAVLIIEQRSQIAKEHLWVLWTDYFKPEHVEKYPQIHDLFWRATKAAGATGTKGSIDPESGQKLIDLIDEISDIFWETKGGKPA